MGRVYRDGRAITSDLKREICPYCKNELTWIGDEVCEICHRHLVNRCTMCDHENPNNARYCELCGAETFFLKEKLLFAFDTQLSSEEIKRLKKTRREIYEGRKPRRGSDDEPADRNSDHYKHLLEENPMVVDHLWNLE